MGDSAGTPAVVIGQPIVQLEGLVMDKKFLDNIREQRNLLDVLKEYRVRYYVSTNAVPSGNGCFDLSEPKVAGPRSPHMRATFAGHRQSSSGPGNSPSGYSIFSSCRVRS